MDTRKIKELENKYRILLRLTKHKHTKPFQIKKTPKKSDAVRRHTKNDISGFKSEFGQD